MISAVDVVRWLYNGCFDSRFSDILGTNKDADIFDLFDALYPDEIVERIEGYESRKSIKRDDVPPYKRMNA